MKKLMFTLAGCLMLAVSAAGAGNSPEWFYIHVKINYNGAIEIDSGETAGTVWERYRPVLAENNGRFRAGSTVAALNYMSRKGWTVVSGYVRSEGAVNEYLMRKETEGFDRASVEKLFDNLKLKKD